MYLSTSWTLLCAVVRADGRKRRNTAFLFMPLFESACERARAASRESAACVIDCARTKLPGGLIGVFGEVTRTGARKIWTTTKILIPRLFQQEKIKYINAPSWRNFASTDSVMSCGSSINNSRVHPQGAKTQVRCHQNRGRFAFFLHAVVSVRWKKRQTGVF